MAISRIGSASGTTSCTLPAHIAGDTILICAFRDGNNTAPSLGANYININNSGANTCSMRIGYKVATSSSEVSGTWTNATSVIAVVYRGNIQIGSVAVGGASNTTFSYTGVTLHKTDSTSWMVGFAGTRDGTNTTVPNVQIAPSGMTNITSVKDTTDAMGAHDTNGTVSAWSTQTQATGVAANGWRSVVVELIDMGNLILGYDATGPSTTTLTDWFVGTSFDCIKAGSVNKVNARVWADPGQSITMDCAIFTETSPNNYTLIRNGLTTITVNDTVGWKTFNIGATLTVGARYYVAMWSASKFNYSYCANAQINKSYATTGNTFNIWPSPESGGSVDAVTLNLYLSYVSISGSISGTCSIAGTLKGYGKLVTSVSGTSTVTGTISSTGGGGSSIAGSISCSSACIGSLSARGKLSGQSLGTSSASALLKAVAYLQGSVPGVSSVSGLLKGRGSLSANIAGASNVSGQLRAYGYMSGNTAGNSNTSGSVNASAGLRGNISCSSVTVGILKGFGYIQASIVASSNASGELIADGKLSGNISCTSDVSGELSAQSGRRRIIIVS